MPPSFHRFPTRDAAVTAAADDIAARLTEAITTRGEALFLATGGVTPIPLYEALTKRDLDWAKVTILPSDARWLPEDQDGSNDGMIRRTLLQGRAAAARFLPLHGGEATTAEALPRLRAMIAALPRPDVSLLGIGEDGHTASFFKGSPEFAAATDPDSPEQIVAATALQGAMTPHRLTLTLPMLLTSRATRLLFFGEPKRAVYEEALKPGPLEDLPVRTLIHQDRSPLAVYWAA